jgi:hypothetical protein
MFHRCDDHGENLSLTRRTLNITQKISVCKFNYTKNIYLFCYGNGGMRVAGGMTLESDLSDLSDLSDKIGAPVFALTSYAAASHGIPRGFACRCGGWLGGRFTPGVCRAFLMATAVCESAGAWRNKTVTNGG